MENEEHSLTRDSGFESSLHSEQHNGVQESLDDASQDESGPGAFENEKSSSPGSPSFLSSQSNGTFITSTVVSDVIPQSSTLNQSDDSYENSQQRRQIEEALEEHRKQQEAVRGQLSEFLEGVKGKKDEEGNPLVQFPEAYESIVDYLKQQRNLGEVSNDVIRQFIDASSVSEQDAMDDIKEGEDLETGMNRIRKLDLLLYHSEEKFRDVSKRVKQIIKNDRKNNRMRSDKKMSLRNFILHKQRTSGADSSDDNSSTQNSPSNRQRRSSPNDHSPKDDEVPFPDDEIYLTKTQQDRIAQLLDDHNIDMGLVPPGEGFEPTLEELQRIDEIDTRLRELAPALFEEIDESQTSQEDNAEGQSNTTTATTGDHEPSNVKEEEDDDHKKLILDIDEKIARLYADSNRLAPKLSDEQIQMLLKGIPEADMLIGKSSE
eukprot:CAMPEP_0117449272 /NCGR_PEP_ID=MMETSP0759-20121206/7858_1 /TAXON_ID=63605 /ORGANISM="Percolomonas cosmopolitus, Strain WS" /LENGTH=431 /DNA_ID=CAMNT_0005241739 /DNA_START=649 /DNA_END=1944 /DNA_ORIENTATION=+